MLDAFIVSGNVKCSLEASMSKWNLARLGRVASTIISSAIELLVSLIGTILFPRMSVMKSSVRVM